MPRRKCSKCLYKDSCDGNNVCGYFYPIDDELIDKEIMVENAKAYEEFLEQWRAYVSEDYFF